MRVATLTLLAVLSSPALAQQPVPDTTAAWLYYPLEVGNLWEYRHYGDFVPARFERRVVERDTVIGPHRYFVQATFFSQNGAAWTLGRRDLLRFDTTASRVVALEDGGEALVFCEFGVFGPVACGPGGLPWSYPEGYAYFAGTTTRIGIHTVDVRAKKGFMFHNCPCEQDWIPFFAAPIGYVGAEADFCLYCRTDLVHARVGAVEYGSPIVADESGAPSREGLAVTVEPNPTAGSVRLGLTLREAGPVVVEAFDALGRRVYRAEVALGAGEHALALDASTWRPGPYVIRIVAAGGTAVSTPLIRR